MLPIVFINCDCAPYVSEIMRKDKTVETRSGNTLRRIAGRRVLIAETHKNRPPVVRCSARIKPGFPVRSREQFDLLRDVSRVPVCSPHDWKESTTVKWIYELTDVCPVPVPFIPAEGVRHGRVWMEYSGKVGDAE